MRWTKADRTRTARKWKNEKRPHGKFMTQERMRQIRFEESLCHAQAKRHGVTGHVIQHSTCGCGAMDCVNYPWLQKDGQSIGGMGGIN